MDVINLLWFGLLPSGHPLVFSEVYNILYHEPNPGREAVSVSSHLSIIVSNTVKPLNTADLGTGEKAAVFGKQRYWESYITYKTHIWDLKMGGGIEGDDCNNVQQPSKVPIISSK